PTLFRSSTKDRNILCIGGGSALKGCRACDEYSGARGDGAWRGFEIDTSIDFEFDGGVFAIDPLADCLDLLQLTFDEALAAEARIDAHDKHEIEVSEKRPEVFDGRARIEHEAGLRARGLDRLHGAVWVRTCLGVEGDDVRARARKGIDIGIDRRDH